MRKFLFAYIVSVTLAFGVGNEITPTIGGVHPFSSNNFDDHTTYGVRLGLGVNDSFVDQVELGYDYSHDVKHDTFGDKASFNRLYLNVLKELNVSNKTKLYALVGLGHEDISHASDDDGAFGQYGAGLKYYFNEYLALKGEVRHALKFDDGKSNMFFTVGLAFSIGGREKAPAIVEAPVDITVSEPAKAAEELNGLEKTIIKTFELSTSEKRHFNFDFDKAQILTSDKDVAKLIAEDLQKYGDIRLRAEGHADITGSKWYNLQLSQKRADAVKKELNENGIDLSRIDSEGCSSERPLKPNDTEEGRAENRRVEVVFVAPITYFELGSAKLLDEGEKMIKIIADNLKGYDEVNIKTEGYTDSIGSKWYNLELSWKRANAVKDKLVEYGIKPGKISAKGFGEAKPIKSNDTEEGRAANRRVDIVFVNPER
ncbi:MAG: OmpA family protein [Campylobacteraceae bacterium]|nr:OmpA family protein [Campylobacteraceae bacterium]